MEKIKLKTSYYGQPTHKWLRMLGDFCNYASASVAVVSVIQDDKLLSVVFILVGALGKAISNMFTYEGN